MLYLGAPIWSNKAWVGSCKQLVLSLNGATVVDASPAFKFK